MLRPISKQPVSTDNLAIFIQDHNRTTLKDHVSVPCPTGPGDQHYIDMGRPALPTCLVLRDSSSS
jgi:hypothetical protein